MAEYGFAALINVSAGDHSGRLFFYFGLSEFGAAFNADVLFADMAWVGAIAISLGHDDNTGGFRQMTRKIGRKGIHFKP